MDPESLPDYVAPGATEDTVTVEELQDPDWMKQLQDQLDALEVNSRPPLFLQLVEVTSQVLRRHRSIMHAMLSLVRCANDSCRTRRRH